MVSYVFSQNLINISNPQGISVYLQVAFVNSYEVLLLHYNDYKLCTNELWWTHNILSEITLILRNTYWELYILCLILF